jgi:hypothetical protein
MNLKRETIKASLIEFSEAYGWPRHADTPEKLKRLISVYHEKLAHSFTEDTFERANKRAWSRARGFPFVADFHEFGKDPQKAEDPLKGYVFPKGGE